MDDFKNEYKKLPQKWIKIPGGPYLWLRKWGSKNNEDMQIQNNISNNSNFFTDNYLIAIASGGGLIATYHKSNSSSSHISKYLNIYSPDFQFLNKILIKLKKPNINMEWYTFCNVSYIAFTPDELIVVLLCNFTLLVFNSIGALINFSVFKNNENRILPTNFKPINARLISYSLSIFSANNTFLYISDVRNPFWTSLNFTDFNIEPAIIFDFIPLSDFHHPLLFYIKNESTISSILGSKSKDIIIPNHKILSLSISPDFLNVACLLNTQNQTESSAQNSSLYYILFCDRHFSPSSRKRISITSEKLSLFANSDEIISNLENFSNFCWCGNSSVLLNYDKFCLFIHISGGMTIIENPTSSLILFPEIDGARIIYTNVITTPTNNNSSNKVNVMNKQSDQFRHIFVSIVPEFVESIFTKTDYHNFCHDYIEWNLGTFQEEFSYYAKNNVSDDELKIEIENLIKASKFITEENLQQVFLGTSWFSKAFLDPVKRIPINDDKQLMKAFERIRILHLLRKDLNTSDEEKKSSKDIISQKKSSKKMLITYEEMEYLSFPIIISRLCNRGEYDTALVISKIVEEERSPIFNHKALMSIYSHFRSTIKNDSKSLEPKRIIDKCTRNLIDLDYSQLAMASYKMGDIEICKALLNLEEDIKKKLPVYLLLGEVEEAFSIAEEIGDQKIINEVAQYAIDHNNANIVTYKYKKALLPLARFDEIDKKQISLLVFMIRSMEKKALLAYLFSILKKKLLPPEEIINELLHRLWYSNLLHFHKCFSQYINLIKWIKDGGDEYLKLIINSGLSSNIRLITVNNQITNDYSDHSSSNIQPENNNNNEYKTDLNDSNENGTNSNSPQQSEKSNSKEQEGESESKQRSKDLDDESGSEIEYNSNFEFESDSKSTSKSKPKKKSKDEKEPKSKLKSKRKTKTKIKFVQDSDSEQEQKHEMDQGSDIDEDENSKELNQSKDSDKKKKEKLKEKDDDKKKSSKKKKKDKKEIQKKKNKEESEVKNESNPDKNTNKNKVKAKAKSNEESSNSNESKTKQKAANNNEDNNNNNDNIDNKKNEKESENTEDSTNDNNNDENKKKKIINLKLPFHFKNKQKSKSGDESKEENENNEEEKPKEINENEEKERKRKEQISNLKKTIEDDQLRANYGSQIRKNVSAMKTIEFELSNGRREQADRIAYLLNLSEPRYVWLLINFYLRTNADDEKLLQLKNKIGLIDGLWVVRRCIVLNRLNIAAAFLENISSYVDKSQAKSELQNAITSKQQLASKVDLKNILY